MTLRLIRGDCREILPTLDRASISAVIFDPPYGRSWSSGFTADGSEIQGDADTEIRDFVLAWASGLSVACWSNWKLAPAGAKARIIWDKDSGNGMGDLSFPWRGAVEDCYLWGDWIGDGRNSVVRVKKLAGMALVHPHEKPTELLARIIETAPPGIILDPTCGSGSTLIAARNMGRDAIGIEIDERWHRVAKLRIAQGALFSQSRDIV